jgi:hypothetical protein
MDYSYIKNTPAWLVILIVTIIFVSILPLLNLFIVGYNSLDITFNNKFNLEKLGQFGDFFGGHTAAFTGSASLIVVLFFTFHQAKQQVEFFQTQQLENKKLSERDLFLQGINVITQWDIASPGCDQCMRLLDYYSRLALNSKDTELLLILNTIITHKIRENLKGKNGSFKKTNYPFACKAVEEIGVIRREEGLRLKDEARKQPSDLSTP